MMSYRFVKVTSFYRDYLRQYYSAHPQVIGQSYENQYRHLMDQKYGWSDFYARHLRTLGVESYEIVFNAEHLQQAWAREHGVTGSFKEILSAQLQALQPDVVYFQESFKLNGEWISHLRERISSIKQAIGYCCAPYSLENIKQFKVFDYMIVCSPLFYQEFQKKGLQIYQMYHGFEASLIPFIKSGNQYPFVDFLFTGSLGPGSEYHDTRQRVLQHLINSNVTMDIYANIITIKKEDLFLRQLAYMSAALLKKTGLGSLAQSLPLINKAYALHEMPRNLKNLEDIQKRAKPPLFGLEMFKALAHAKISFNIHGDVAGEYAANVRLFEVTGVGSCLLTDWKKNIHELFESDTEIVTYRSPDECVEKVQWLLDHKEECSAIARKGQKRTLRDHNYNKRAEQLHEIILKHL
jgi:spore maturation protein CgeB